MTELYIFTGVAGTGKSHTAHEEGRKYLELNKLDEEIYDLMVPAKKMTHYGFKIIMVNQ